MEHVNIPAGEIHSPHNWEFANSAVRIASGVSDASLIGRVAIQLSDNTTWRLSSVLPTVWSQIVGGIPADVDYIQFDTAPEPVPTTTGALFWDNAEGNKTLSLVMDGATGTTQQIGEETYYRVKASSAITEGHAVMVTGSVGASGVLTAARATGLTYDNPYRILGIATENIAANAFGFVTAFGMVRGFNTTGASVGETWADGDALYYSPVNSGSLTNIPPQAPVARALIAHVIHAGTTGSVFVRPVLGSAFGSTDGNVKFTALSDNNFLVYNAATGLWENRAPAAVKTALSLGNVDNTSDADKPVSTATAAALASKEATVNKGVPSGYASLDAGGKVPAAQLPSFVDDVIEVADFAALPVTGESGKIYVTLGDGKAWRWGGTSYAEISASPGSTDAVPEGVSNLYHTAVRVRDAVLTGLSTASSAVVTAADSVLTALGKIQAQIIGHVGNIANPHSVTKAQVGLGNVDNTSDANKPVSTAQQAALDLKLNAANPSYTGTLTGTTGGATIPNAYYYAARNASNTLTLPLIGRGADDRVKIDPDGYGVDIGGGVVNIGSGQFYKDASGNVGVGTASPAAKLDVNGEVRSRTVDGFVINDGTKLGSFSYAGGLMIDRVTGSSLLLAHNGSVQAALNPAGNFGLGVTPSAWNNDYKALNIGVNSALYGRVASSGTSGFSTNAYRDAGGSWIYQTTSVSSARYEQDAGSHTWFTAPSGTAGNPISFTQAMTLDASGNLLVGTTSNPYVNKAVIGGSLSILGSQLNVAPGTGAQYEIVNRNGAGFDFFVNNAGTLATRIDASGNLLVGTTASSGSRLEVAINSATGASGYLYNASDTAGARCLDLGLIGQANQASSMYIRCADATAFRFQVLGNGNVQNVNNSYGAISDLKLKDNIVDVTPKLAKLLKVRVVNYTLKADPNKTKLIGVIAQELEQISPGLVEEALDYEEVTKTREVEVPAVDAVLDEDGNEVAPAIPATTRTEEYTERVPTGTTTKTVKYSVFVPILIKALQEGYEAVQLMQQQLDAQNTAMQMLAERVAALEARV